jgi:hypothetical protein
MRRIDNGQPLKPVFGGEGAQFLIGGAATIQGNSYAAIIRWGHSDTRAVSALQKKGAQVRDGIANVVVIEVGAVGGVGAWPEELAQLSGEDFDKIGAVLFFDQTCLGPPEKIRRRWRVVVNPVAQMPVPAALLDQIESLDESGFYDLVAKPRLRMQS